MDNPDVATPLGAWATVRGYFTPATLFLVLNLVIGTIVLTSRSHQRRRREHHHEYYAHHHHQQGHYQEPPLDPHQQQPQEYHHYYQQQQPLARTSSVLDRLRSIGLYRFRSGDFPPEYGAAASANGHDAFAPVLEKEVAEQYARSRSEPAPAREEGRAPPRVRKLGAERSETVRKSQVAQPPVVRVVEAVAEDDEAVESTRAEQEEFAGSLRRLPASPPRKAEYRYQEEEDHVPPPAPMRAPAPLSRTSSVLDRLRSMGLSSFLGAEQPAAPYTDSFTSTAVPAAETKHYDRSRSEPAREQGKQAPEAKMAKSSSTTRKPAAAPRLVGQPSINTRADAFIDSFKREQSQKQTHRHDADDEHVISPPPAPLARTSSVLDRLLSFGLYLRAGDPVPADAYAAPAPDDEKKQAQAAQYGRSRSEPAREQGKRKTPGATKARMSKTSSEADVTEPAEECVDARADDFINKFRQQLQLQRLNSLLGRTKS